MFSATATSPTADYSRYWESAATNLGTRHCTNDQANTASESCLSEGYAAAYANYPFVYADDFLEQQRSAREARRGLWADSVGAVPLLAEPTAGVPARRDVNCSDFKTQREAQAFYVAAGPGDPHRLDDDRDGIVCEALPPG